MQSCAGEAGEIGAIAATNRNSSRTNPDGSPPHRSPIAAFRPGRRPSLAFHGVTRRSRDETKSIVSKASIVVVVLTKTIGSCIVNKGFTARKKMKLLQLIKCWFGHHYRNGHRVRWIDGRRHSVCKGCGRAMVRDPDGWRLTQKPTPAH
jgi:hypothetical protein